jgi:hypothetical protein
MIGDFTMPPHRCDARSVAIVELRGAVLINGPHTALEDCEVAFNRIGRLRRHGAFLSALR